jgi:hypothetical protein
MLPLCQVTMQHTLLSAHISNVLYTANLSTDRIDIVPIAASSSAAGTTGCSVKRESVPVSAQLFAGGIQLDRTVERAPDGALIGGAGFGAIASAVVSAKYEIEQRPCLYVLDCSYNAIRRIELPADWSVLPDM